MIYKIINWYKKECKLLFVCLIFGIFVTLGLSLYTKSYSESMVSGISNEVIRFHVKANSDEFADQQLKAKVKDTVLETLANGLNESNSLDETRAYIELNLAEITNVATAVILENGYNYEVNAYLTKEFFPTKTYGNISLPNGSYEALRIDIGEYEGANWWCIMYPPLCFVDVTSSEISEKDKAVLQSGLTTEQYKLISMEDSNNLIPIEVKFKVVEWWQRKKLDDKANYVNKN
jgi:stage II sporulation protein R